MHLQKHCSVSVNRAGVSLAGVWGVPLGQAVRFSAWPAPVYPLFMYTLTETRFSVVSVNRAGVSLAGVWGGVPFASFPRLPA